jgi:hypothetical protein
MKLNGLSARVGTQVFQGKLWSDVEVPLGWNPAIRMAQCTVRIALLASRVLIDVLSQILTRNPRPLGNVRQMILL